MIRQGFDTNRLPARIYVDAPGAEVTEAELLAFCLERLAKYKTPREVRFVGSLPKSPIGKILKKDLRAILSVPADTRLKPD